MRLVIDGFGKFIGVENGMIVVKEKGKTLRKIRAEELKQLLIAGNSSISSEAIKILMHNGVDIVFFIDDKVARISHPLLGTAKTRREQYLAYYDERGLVLAKEILKAKIRNQAFILFNLAKSRKEKTEVSEVLIDAKGKVEKCMQELEVIKASKIENVREELFGIEGKASKIYWQGVAKIIPKEYNFEGREGLESGTPRFAKDIVNAMLNYGYAILFAECCHALELVGLDPYAGFLHTDRSGRESLAIDLMECFRQQIVDRVVLKLISYSRIKPSDCEIRNFVCHLNDNARKLLLSEILGRFEEKTQYKGKSISMSAVILSQAREIAGFLKGENEYAGFSQNW